MGRMFEKEIKFIIDFILNRIKKLGSFFTFEKLALAEIHPAIILYISNKLDYLIYEDRKKLLQNSTFDYSGSEIAKYFNLIGAEIKKNKRLALEDVKLLVTQAVTFNINYLVKPNGTLLKLIFEENKTRNVNEIRIMLNYLYYYDYVRNVFLGYFSKRKILSLSETEFGLILNKIDKQMFGEHKRDLIDNALVSIGDFFNEGGVNKTRISTQTIELFLKEKNLMEALFKLRRSIPAEDKGKYDIEEIRKVIYSKDTVVLEPEKETEEISEEPAGELTEKEEISEQGSEIIVEETYIEEPEIEKEEISETEINPAGKEETGAEEEKEIIEDAEKFPETDQQKDFLSRYESELKSLKELEEKLNDLDKEEFSSIEFETEEEPEEEPEGEKVTEKEERKEVKKEIEKEVKKEVDKEIKKKADKEEQVAQPGSESLTFEEIMSDREIQNSDENLGEEIDDKTFDELIIEEEEFIPFSETEESKTPETEETENHITEEKGNADKIISSLTDKEKERIIDNVFNKDKQDFVDTMEKISSASSYDEATEILKAVFLTYKVNLYSKDALTLTNAVSNYFNRD